MATRKGSLILVTAAFPLLSETFIVKKFLGLLDYGWDVHVVALGSRPPEWACFPELQSQPEIRQRVHRARFLGPRWRRALDKLTAVGQATMHSPNSTWGYVQQGVAQAGVGAFRKLGQDVVLLSRAPDIIHFEFGALAVGRMYLKEWLGCQVVVSFRGYDLNFFRLEDPDCYRDVWEHADALHLLGEDLWYRAQRRGCPPEKYHVLIPPAVDHEFRHPGARAHHQRTGTPARPLRLLSVGRLVWKKGYEYALQAVKHLTDAGVHCEYRIIGDGEYLDAVLHARAQLELETTVDLLRGQPHRQVREQLLWADVFLHAAVSEGFCNAVVEAQAMGLPVVCTDADGLAENVRDGETGFVVPRRDPRALADKLRVLADDASIRQKFSDASRHWVQARFRLEEQISAFDHLYQQILVSKVRPRKLLTLVPMGHDVLPWLFESVPF